MRRTGEQLDSAIQKVLRDQLGLIRRSQALRLGFTARGIHWRISRRRWQRILPGLYAVFTGELTEQQRLVAAALYAGAGAQITGAAALRWHRVRYAPSDARIHVLIPATAHRASKDFVVIIRTTRLDKHSRLRPTFEVCSVARATADAARISRDLREIRAFATEVVQRKMISAAQLADELREGPMPGSALLRRTVHELGAGVLSAPEAEFRQLVLRSRVLPQVLWNAKLETPEGQKLPTPDGWIQEVGLAFEVDSREHHASIEGWRRTMDRHNVLASHGVLTLHFTPQAIRKEPERVLGLIEQAYRERRAEHSWFARVRVVDD